jgi:hypothetical protein
MASQALTKSVGASHIQMPLAIGKEVNTALRHRPRQRHITNRRHRQKSLKLRLKTIHESPKLVVH